ncbi:MAG: trigger factor [Bdellovibrionia bacterium]
MKINLETISKLERKLHIEVPIEKVKASLERVYKGIQDVATIKGFRKGKAPIATVKSMYKDKVRDDVIRDLIESHYFEALKEKAVEPITQPQFEFDVLNEDQPFKFTAHFEVKPDVKLEQHEGLPVEKEKLELDDERVTAHLTRLRESKATEAPLFEDRPAQKGDLATIDFEGFIAGAPVENSKGVDQTVELGNSGFIPGFDDGVIGMRPGITANLNLKFPDDYPPEMASKDVTFKITLKKLSKKSIPDLNEDFVKSVSEFKSVDELKNAIRDDIKKSEEGRIKKDLRNRILKALVDRNPVEVPPTLLREQKMALMQDIQQRMQQQGFTPDQFADYVKKWDSDFENSAKFIIQSSFLINAVADKHGLRATQGEMDEKLTDYAQQTGIEMNKLKEFYGQPERQSSLRFQITEEKVVDYLISKANVRELPKEKLTPQSEG